MKFHVKNILRKLSAANRVEAASRYMQLDAGAGDHLTKGREYLSLGRCQGQVAG